jgi:hypothetical protein
VVAFDATHLVHLIYSVDIITVKNSKAKNGVKEKQEEKTMPNQF